MFKKIQLKSQAQAKHYHSIKRVDNPHKIKVLENLEMVNFLVSAKLVTTARLNSTVDHRSVLDLYV